VAAIRRALSRRPTTVPSSKRTNSGAPDPRWSNDELHTLGQVKGSDFEVVQMDNLTAP
jgi:hypothetical protein